MGLAWWMLGMVAVAGKYDGQPSDIEVFEVIQATPDAVHAAVSDWETLQAIFPADCASEWELQERTTGVGARSRAKYRFGPLRRQLVGVVLRDDPGLVFEVELEGDKGWFLQVTYEAANAGTKVHFTTPLEAPQKWPVVGAFYNKVKPAWESCYLRSLQALAARVES